MTSAAPTAKDTELSVAAISSKSFCRQSHDSCYELSRTCQLVGQLGLQAIDNCWPHHVHFPLRLFFLCFTESVFKWIPQSLPSSPFSTIRNCATTTDLTEHDSLDDFSPGRADLALNHSCTFVKANNTMHHFLRQCRQVYLETGLQLHPAFGQLLYSGRPGLPGHQIYQQSTSPHSRFCDSVGQFATTAGCTVLTAIWARFQPKFDCRPQGH